MISSKGSKCLAPPFLTKCPKVLSLKRCLKVDKGSKCLAPPFLKADKGGYSNNPLDNHHVLPPAPSYH